MPRNRIASQKSWSNCDDKWWWQISPPIRFPHVNAMRAKDKTSQPREPNKLTINQNVSVYVPIPCVLLIVVITSLGTYGELLHWASSANCGANKTVLSDVYHRNESTLHLCIVSNWIITTFKGRMRSGRTSYRTANASRWFLRLWLHQITSPQTAASASDFFKSIAVLY